MTIDKVLEQFHYFNINTDIDSVFGNWAVSVDGNVVNCLYPYIILAIHHKDAEWIEKMKAQIWFKPECEEPFAKTSSKDRRGTKKGRLILKIGQIRIPSVFLKQVLLVTC